MSAREVFEKMRSYWVDGASDDMWSDDLVVENPFARPGRPKRVEGGQTFREIAVAGRAALPVTFEACNILELHETADPNVIVVEYELVARSNITGEQDSARFIGVLKVRDGKAVLWREYQDTMKLVAAGV
ncbi:nuclear transport factor 2 family protein [Actinocrispum sp. NPDC049592]|uniref:nuclear transport factor 2 family protein n=1 Tax=Actinocrispum sp. NPDC049592 TaxID=3154835 RepID=UPI003439896F